MKKATRWVMGSVGAVGLAAAFSTTAISENLNDRYHSHPIYQNCFSSVYENRSDKISFLENKIDFGKLTKRKEYWGNINQITRFGILGVFPLAAALTRRRHERYI